MNLDRSNLYKQLTTTLETLDSGQKKEYKNLAFDITIEREDQESKGTSSRNYCDSFDDKKKKQYIAMDSRVEKPRLNDGFIRACSCAGFFELLLVERTDVVTFQDTLYIVEI